MLKKIVVLGPESTGKSTLCEMLAQHFDTQWCPEFAREYLMTNGTDYDFEDLLTIAKGQLALEEEYVQMMGSREVGESGSREDGKWGSGEDGKTENREVSDGSTHQNAFGLSNFPTFQPSNFSTKKLLFIDTDQYVMKVWCEYVFGDCHNWILRRIAERPYDLYLLCKPDLPWVPDALREYPDEKPRQELYHIYRDILLNQPVSWAEIYGSYNQRFELARDAVMTLL